VVDTLALRLGRVHDAQPGATVNYKPRIPDHLPTKQLLDKQHQSVRLLRQNATIVPVKSAWMKSYPPAGHWIASTQGPGG
jgi:hypothetical protein